MVTSLRTPSPVSRSLPIGTRALDCANVAFPEFHSTSITPATTDRERAILRDKCGLETIGRSFCEEFRQWVVEDKFPTGRTGAGDGRVTFTSMCRPTGDEDPYPQWRSRRDCLIQQGCLTSISFTKRWRTNRSARSSKADQKRGPETVVPPPPNTSLDELSRIDCAPLRQSEDRRHHPAPLL